MYVREGNRHLDLNFAAYPRTLSEIFAGTAQTAGYEGHNCDQSLSRFSRTNRIILVNIRYPPFHGLRSKSHSRKLLDRIIYPPRIDLLLDLAWLIKERIQLICRR